MFSIFFNKIIKKEPSNGSYHWRCSNDLMLPAIKECLFPIYNNRKQCGMQEESISSKKRIWEHGPNVSWNTQAIKYQGLQSEALEEMNNQPVLASDSSSLSFGWEWRATNGSKYCFLQKNGEGIGITNLSQIQLYLFYFLISIFCYDFNITWLYDRPTDRSNLLSNKMS